MRKTLVAVMSIMLLVSSATSASAHRVPSSWVNPEHVNRSSNPVAIVTNLRYSSHTGYDRVVVDMKDKPSGYDVRYVDKLTYCGSGETLKTVPGRKYIQITLTPAQTHTDQGANTYQGPVNRNVNLQTVKRIVLTCNFESVVQFGLVVDAKRAFHTTTLYHPSRVYLDVNS